MATRTRQLLEEHRRILREALTRHGGVEVDTQGDAFFAAFARATDAVAAAEDALSASWRSRCAWASTRASPQSLTRATSDWTCTAPRASAQPDTAARSSSPRRRSACCRAPSSATSASTASRTSAQPLRLYQLGERDFPPLRSAQPNEPARSAEPAGRQGPRARGTARRSSSSPRLVTLTGPGGSGKTRLALQVAAELVEEFRDGVFWVPLATVTDSTIWSAGGRPGDRSKGRSRRAHRRSTAVAAARQSRTGGGSCAEPVRAARGLSEPPRARHHREHCFESPANGTIRWIRSPRRTRSRFSGTRAAAVDADEAVARDLPARSTDCRWRSSSPPRARVCSPPSSCFGGSTSGSPC